MSFGPPAGSPFGGSATSASAAAGLPFAGMPSELVDLAEKILDEEPEHPESDVELSQHDYERRPFMLRSFLYPHRRGLIGALLLVIVETIAFQAGPLLTQIGLDRAIVPRRPGVLVLVAGAYLGAIAVNAVASRARIRFTGALGEQLMYELRVKVFTHFQRQSLDFYTRQPGGVLLTRMTSDIDALTALFQDGLVNLAVQGFTLIVITVVLVVLNPTLAAITLLVVVPCMLVLTTWFRGASERTYENVRDKIANVLADLSESLAGMRVIVAHNRRRHNLVHHSNVVGEHRDANIAASRVGAIFGPSSEAVGVAGQAVLLLIGGRMVLNGSLTVGELFAFLLYLTAFFAPVQQLVQLYNAYQSGQAAVAKLRGVLATEPSVVERPDAVTLPPIEGRITFERVSFSYVHGEPVLHDVSLTIEPGETMAVVGPTGAGKSTVAKLATRFYDPDSGTISIDGNDLRTVTLHSLRSQLGVVPQEPFLFNRSIRDNIAFARPDATDAEVAEACRAVGIDDLVDRLDDGLDSLVHERGSSLSSGERQLLALARAFLARPRVLVLDEATSNLDLALETRIERALDVVLEGRTAIVIAHRLATAMRADRIAVVEDGRLTELGSHDELVALGGHYASLFATWESHASQN